MSQKSLKFSFSNNRGQTLSGLLEMPSEPPVCFAVFAPCFTCTKESHGAHKISRNLAQQGVATLRFDLTGLGASEGDFAETNFSTRILDIIAASDALAVAHEAPKLLIGHSISGTAAIAAAEKIASVQAVATLGAPADPAHVIEGLERNNAITITGGMAEMTISGRKITVKKQMVDDMLAHPMTAETAALTKRIFIFHAPHDAIVPFRNAETIFERVTADKELIPLSNTATHLMEQGNEDSAFIAETLRGWADLHLI